MIGGYQIIAVGIALCSILSEAANFRLSIELFAKSYSTCGNNKNMLPAGTRIPSIFHPFCKACQKNFAVTSMAKHTSIRSVPRDRRRGAPVSMCFPNKISITNSAIIPTADYNEVTGMVNTCDLFIVRSVMSQILPTVFFLVIPRSSHEHSHTPVQILYHTCTYIHFH